MNIYKKYIQHFMDIYDEIFIVWPSIFINLSIYTDISSLDTQYLFEFFECVTTILYYTFFCLFFYVLYFQMNASFNPQQITWKN